MGPLIGLVLLFIVISVLNDSFIDPSNLKIWLVRFPLTL